MAYEGDVNERWSWTENRVHELRRLIAEKLTSAQIAEGPSWGPRTVHQAPSWKGP